MFEKREKFEGPFVKKVMSYRVSYFLEKLNNGQCINEIRAYKVQLRPWGTKPPGKPKR